MEHQVPYDYEYFFKQYEDGTSKDITQVVELLKIFQKYLDSIYLEVWEFRNKSTRIPINFITVIATLTKYMTIIYNYYNKIDINTISHNI
jgi:hypothetical protein